MDRTKEVIRQVRKIEITTRNLVDGLVAGNYHSIFRGQGIEFSEIRDYRPGDDIRAIDWKVTARFNHPFVKEFIEERDLRVFFAFDFSASGSFGNIIQKRRKAIELTATLIFSAMRNNDNVGLFIFTDHVERYVPARKGRRHALKLITHMVMHEPGSKKTDLNGSLSFISKVLKKRSILFIVSDFFSDDFGYPLAVLKGRHDVIAVRVWDSREMEIPDVGLIELEDEETGEQVLVDTSDEEFRKNYSKQIRAYNDRLNSLFRKHNIDAVDVVTDDDYAVPLKKFFRTRQMRGMR